MQLSASPVATFHLNDLCRYRPSYGSDDGNVGIYTSLAGLSDHAPTQKGWISDTVQRSVVIRRPFGISRGLRELSGRKLPQFPIQIDAKVLQLPWFNSLSFATGA
jgi:hypothetical protein